MLHPEVNKQKNNMTVSRVRLSLIVLSAMLFAASGGMAASSDVDRIVTELEGPDWQDSLSSSAWVARFNNDSSFQALTELISNKGIDWRIRIRAIRLMGETGNPRGISLLARILNDPVLNNDCPAIKWNTATALGNFRKDSTVLETLIYTLKFENNNVVREAVIESLGKVGDPRAVPSLLPALLDGSFAIKFSAIKALGEIGDPAATPFLKRLSDNDSDPYIRNEALAVLKKLGGKAQG